MPQNAPCRILVVEDDPDGCAAVVDALQEAGCAVTAAATAQAALAQLAQQPFDVLLSDIRLPDMDGLALLQSARRQFPTLPILLMTAYGTVETAVAALKAGAYDYILKPLDLDDLQRKIAHAAETTRLRAEVTQLKTALAAQCGGRPIIFTSTVMRGIWEQVQTVATSRATVLILGESGVGKELVARALHFESDRAAGPFVAVNCGAFAENLLESELFGHEKGAFTGATATHAGAFERAQGGTLFLDEIGIAPARVQERLLRVLEEREIMRVGGSQPVKLDVRVVAASNQDLTELAHAQRFRRDLLFRLQVVTLRIPPLRERREDIRPLAEHFIAAAAHEYGRKLESVAQDYYRRLEEYHWPGNVRELKHAVEASVLLAKTGKLTAADLQLGAPHLTTGDLAIPPGMTLSEIERAAIAGALRRHDGSRTAAAEELGIAVRTIQRKIREYNLPF